MICNQITEPYLSCIAWIFTNIWCVGRVFSMCDKNVLHRPKMWQNELHPPKIRYKYVLHTSCTFHHKSVVYDTFYVHATQKSQKMYTLGAWTACVTNH